MEVDEFGVGDCPHDWRFSPPPPPDFRWPQCFYGVPPGSVNPPIVCATDCRSGQPPGDSTHKLHEPDVITLLLLGCAMLLLVRRLWPS